MSGNSWREITQTIGITTMKTWMQEEKKAQCLD